MQRLRAAQHRRHRLNRRPNHIHIRLLRRQARPRRLGMKPQHARSLILRPEPFLHQPRVDPPRSPELGNLPQKIHVGVKKK